MSDTAPKPLPEAARKALNAVQWNLSGQAVEDESFARIDALRDPDMAEDRWRVVRRLIHTTGDPELAGLVSFSETPDPMSAGRKALQACAPIFCDSNMIRSGLSLPRLRTQHPDYSPERLRCHITDPDVVERAKATGHTRALCAAEKARPWLDGAVVLVGNAPLALARICKYILEEDMRPALLIAIPVGFVNVEESKALLPFCPVPFITVRGRRGGSPLAVAALHALMESAS